MKNKNLTKSFAALSLLSFLALFYSISLFAQQDLSTRNSNYYHFVGTINGDLPIVMDLVEIDDKFSGSYYYTEYNQPIFINGEKNKEGEIELFVTDYEGNITEFITGDITEVSFLGKWKNKDKTKTLPIVLKEDYSKSVFFTFTAMEDSLVLQKDNSENPRAFFFNVIVETNQVPKGSNLKKIKETLNTYQLFENEDKSLSVSKIVEDNKEKFFAEYQNELKEGFEYTEDKDINSFTYLPNWSIQSDIDVVYNENHFATLAFNYYQYMGGAHGMYGVTYLVLDTKTGNQMKLEDIFDKDALAILSQKMEEMAYAYVGVTDATSLEDAGYFVDKLEVTDNFSVTGRGITFLYQPYEIGAYAIGTPTFSFSWREIKDLIKKNSPVRSLIK